MFTHLPIGWTVVPSLRSCGAGELEDYSSFCGGSFQVFMGTLRSKNLNLMPGKSRGGLL
jgi:hypothetical protein